MATFSVTNLFDSGFGSLRNAIFQANTASTTDDIAFNPSLSGGTIGLTSGELGISDNLTINGLGADFLSVDAGGNPFSVFNVNDVNYSNNLDIAIKGLTITGGNTAGYGGGGILNNENLTVTNSTISGNRATYGGGGIFARSGNVTVTNSTISGNTAGFGGGGIDSSADVTVSNSTISGNTAGSGGGVYIYYEGGTLTLTNSTISGNSGGSGGGIDNNGRGEATVTNSTISGNTAGFGGGINNNGNYSTGITVNNSTISGNTARYGGGGINNEGSSNIRANDGTGIVTVNNSTISGNTARYGGGINNDDASYGIGIVTVNNSTISGNTAEEGGGINNNSNNYAGSTATVTSSIIAANTDNEDIGGDTPFTSGGNNLIGNGDGTAGFTNGVNGDQVGTTSNPIDPLLGELQNNGGPTQTQALLPGSPAINAGSNPLGLEFDQRGPGFDRVVGAQTDIGAYEVVPEPDSTLGVLGVAVLGVVLLRKRHQLKKTKA